MTRLLPLPHSLAIALAGLTLVATPGHADTRRIGVTSFDRIEVEGDMTVIIEQSPRTGAVVEGSRRALDTLSLDVNDGRLRVRMLSEGAFGPRRTSDGTVTVRLTTTNLRSIVVDGAAQVSARGMRGEAATLTLTGAGQIRAEAVTASSVQMRASGSGSITITGQSRDVTALINGSAQIDASGLQARGLTVQQTGSGSSVFAASGTAQLTAIGSGNLTVTGRPRCTVNNNGSGQIACGTDSQRRALPS